MKGLNPAEQPAADSEGGSAQADETTGLGLEVKRVARLVSDQLVAPGFAVKPTSTILFLNSLISARHSQRRIYLNGFQREAEVLNYFGHRLRRLGFDVQALQPQAILLPPKPLDVMITLSGSLTIEPVLVSLLHADLQGLYRFVISAQPAEDTIKEFHAVLPVHIPSSLPAGEGEGEEGRALLPLGSLFELRTFLHFEAITELLTQIFEQVSGLIGVGEQPSGEPSLEMMSTFKSVRESAQRMPEVMQGLVEQYQAELDNMDDRSLGEVVEQLLATYDWSQTVYVTGFGRNSAVGGMLAHRLASLGLKVAMTPSRLERPSRKDDFLVALTASGNTYGVVQRLSGAKQGGLRTAVVTAIPDSALARYADTVLVIPGFFESGDPSYERRQVQPGDALRPSQTTFNFNALMTLEALSSVLMGRLGKTERDLTYTDPWQGFDSVRTRKS